METGAGDLGMMSVEEMGRDTEETKVKRERGGGDADVSRKKGI